MLIGGRAPEYLRNDPRVLAILREFDAHGKWIFAICHGVQLVAAAGLLEGKKVTCYEHVRLEAEAAGGRYVDRRQPSATDGWCRRRHGGSIRRSTANLRLPRAAGRRLSQSSPCPPSSTGRTRRRRPLLRADDQRHAHARRPTPAATAIVDALDGAGHAVVGRADRARRPDDVRDASCARQVGDATSIITTGGTGITSRDSTYEAIAALLEKRLDGFGELFRMLSYARDRHRPRC